MLSIHWAEPGGSKVRVKFLDGSRKTRGPQTSAFSRDLN